jgi:hypothetical protein
MLITLDLDHTIIDYSISIEKLAVQMNIELDKPLTKDRIKMHLKASDRTDAHWRNFQQLLYTNGLKFAKPQIYLESFCSEAKKRKFSLEIISVKSDDLQSFSSEWLSNHFDRSLFSKISYVKNNIQKIALINKRMPKIHIDDLFEIILNPNLSASIIGILFNNESSKPKLSKNRFQGNFDFARHLLMNINSYSEDYE